jgi:GAF domain-containing protein
MMARPGIETYAQDADLEGVIRDYVKGVVEERPADVMKYWYDRLYQEMKDDEDDDDEEEEENEENGGMDGEASWVKDVPGIALRQLFEATKRITKEIVPKDSVNAVITETINLLKCDRVSVFIFDPKIDMLILSASNLPKPLRVKRGQGIAGTVFEQKETVNIPDCYADSRFDQSFDLQTGYRTKCMIVVPILDYEKNSVGVLQAINKKDDEVFDSGDVLMMQHLAQQAGIAYRNAELYGGALKSSERSAGLLKMLNALTQSTGAQSMIMQLTLHAKELAQADRCTVFMLDLQRGELWSVSTDTGKEIRIPKDKGIAGECAMDKKVINIPDAYEDPRFNAAFDKASGYHTQSILAVPILTEEADEDGKKEMRLYGVVQLINKTEFDGQVGIFDDDDVNVIETFATFTGTKLRTSSLFRKAKTQDSEGSAAFGTGSGPTKRRSLAAPAEAVVIMEGDEEEEEEY